MYCARSISRNITSNLQMIGTHTFRTHISNAQRLISYVVLMVRAKASVQELSDSIDSLTFWHGRRARKYEHACANVKYIRARRGEALRLYAIYICICMYRTIHAMYSIGACRLETVELSQRDTREQLLNCIRALRARARAQQWCLHRTFFETTKLTWW